MPTGHSRCDEQGAVRGTAEVAGSDARRLFAAELDTITRIITMVTRRNYLSADEAEDFRSWSMVRLLDNDCAVFRKFTGRSSLTTYLAVVVANLFRDYRNHKWGKWRPSAAARRLGSNAVRLDILITRDGQPVDEALRVMRENVGVDASPEELLDLVRRLPRRTQRRVETSDALDLLPGSAVPDDHLERRQREQVAQRAEAALSSGLQMLDAEDRLVLKLRFDDGWTVASIARGLGLEHKPLYRRMERLLRALREALQEAGVDADQAADLMGWPRLDIEVNYGVEDARSNVARPSLEETTSAGAGE